MLGVATERNRPRDEGEATKQKAGSMQEKLRLRCPVESHSQKLVARANQLAAVVVRRSPSLLWWCRLRLVLLERWTVEPRASLRALLRLCLCLCLSLCLLVAGLTISAMQAAVVETCSFGLPRAV